MAPRGGAFARGTPPHEISDAEAEISGFPWSDLICDARALYPIAEFDGANALNLNLPAWATLSPPGCLFLAHGGRLTKIECPQIQGKLRNESSTGASELSEHTFSENLRAISIKLGSGPNVTPRNVGKACSTNQQYAYFN